MNLAGNPKPLPLDSTREASAWVCEAARKIGFDLCGILALGDDSVSFPEQARLPEWLARGYAGEMAYLRDERRADPRRVLPGAESLIVLALNYNTAFPYSTAEQNAGDPARNPGDSPRGWISRYAWGEDYHEVLGEKLAALAAAMHERFSGATKLLPGASEGGEPAGFRAKYYVDTGPVIERVAAKYAGLGWIGKNTCLINRQLGSWLFLGVILTNTRLAPTLGFGEPPPRDLCGSCTRCLDACPTGAFPEAYVMDARRCISYLTIELRGPIPAEFRPAMGNNVFGCDICQDVCPWNRKAPVTGLAAFEPRAFPPAAAAGPQAPGQGREPEPSLFAPELEQLASLSEDEFRAALRRSPVKRAKWRGLVRNACVALGNSRIAADSPSGARVLRLLRELSEFPDAIIAEHARWALGRLRYTETGPAR